MTLSNTIEAVPTDKGLIRINNCLVIIILTIFHGHLVNISHESPTTSDKRFFQYLRPPRRTKKLTKHTSEHSNFPLLIAIRAVPLSAQKVYNSSTVAVRDSGVNDGNRPTTRTD